MIRLLTFFIVGIGVTAYYFHRARRSLGRSEEKYRLLFECASDGILVVDHNSALEANLKAHEILGFEPGELSRSNMRDVTPTEDWTAWLSRFGEAAAGRTVLYECTLLRKDGSRIAVEASGRTLHDGRILLMIRDIRERKHREEQLRQAQRLDAVTRLARSLGEEFNNALTVINGYTELVVESLGPYTPARADLEEIRRAADRAAALTRQLVALDVGAPAEPQLVDLNALITEMESALRDLAGERIRLVISLDPEIGPVRSHPAHLQQVIRNLVLQARDVMPAGGELTIATASAVIDEEYAQRFPGMQPGNNVLLVVRDSGPGLDPETKSHVFEPFVLSKKVGEGFGLCMAYGIVRGSGGHIRVCSEPGQGSTFKIHLPRV